MGARCVQRNRWAFSQSAAADVTARDERARERFGATDAPQLLVEAVHGEQAVARGALKHGPDEVGVERLAEVMLVHVRAALQHGRHVGIAVLDRVVDGQARVAVLAHHRALCH